MPCVFIQVEAIQTVSDTIHDIDLTLDQQLDVGIDVDIRHISSDQPRLPRVSFPEHHIPPLCLAPQCHVPTHKVALSVGVRRTKLSTNSVSTHLQQCF